MRKRRFEAAFIVTVGLGAAGLALAQPLSQNPPARRPPATRRARPLPPLHAGQLIQRDGRGVCRLVDPSPCADGADCTSHDPIVVRCPSELEPNWSMRVLGNGVCELSLYRADGCPPNARCNPPPPRRVTCPGSSTPPPAQTPIVD